MIKKPYAILCVILNLSLILETFCFAQGLNELNISGYLGQLHSQFAADKFRPLHLRYLSYGAEDNTFRLFLDKGDLKNPRIQELENTSKELLKYFFIGITLPNDAFWVNLRPDAEDNIIDDYLAETDIGKIMLEADLQLKKDTALATSPETPEGKEYWEKIYQKAGELFGSDNITIPTLTRPWIVPDEIIVRETVTSAYVYKATLKVMLEEDYLEKSEIRNPKFETNPKSQIINYKQYEFKDPRLKTLNEYSSQLIRELIIPKLTKEVNTAKRYAPLRQVYYSLILSQWFKARFYGKGGMHSYLINRKDLSNLTSQKPWSKIAYFQAYKKSFKDGEYNLKEPVYTPYGQTIRSYFSGGMIVTSTDLDLALRSPTAKVGNVMVQPAVRDFDASGNPILAEMVIQANNPGSEVILRVKRPSVAIPALVEPLVSQLDSPKEIPVSSLSFDPSEEEILAQRTKAVINNVGVEVRAGSLPIEEPASDSGIIPDASSPILDNKKIPDATGGIDFRSLPIVTQAMSNLRLNVASIPLSNLEEINLDQELGEIQKLIKARIIPSAERIKEYIQASCLKGNSDIQKIVLCIADILRVEEERCYSSDSMLKDILVVLESTNSIQELKAVFVGT